MPDECQVELKITRLDHGLSAKAAPAATVLLVKTVGITLGKVCSCLHCSGAHSVTSKFSYVMALDACEASVGNSQCRNKWIFT